MKSERFPIMRPGLLYHPGDRPEDLRARMAHEQAEAQQRRELELLEQSSMRNSPEERIRIWERLHAVAMPRSTAHRLLDVIAADTGLTLEQVHDEQRRRLQPATLPPPPPAGDAP